MACFKLKMTPFPTEYQECRAFWDYCQIVLKLGKRVFHHVNEGKRTYAHTQALKNIGLTPGLLDYQFLIENDKYKGLWIEMKRKDGINKKKNKEQDEFIALLLDSGYYACYSYGYEHAIRIYKDYVNNRL